ncbi:MAG TPA: hypothetical protein DCP03_15445 [Polaromonas sp.]|nr:hypothetical protein [Polaromonas sp.]
MKSCSVRQKARMNKVENFSEGHDQAGAQDAVTLVKPAGRDRLAACWFLDGRPQLNEPQRKITGTFYGKP